MKLCVVGIGGCGGSLAQKFLKNQDIPVFGYSFGRHISFGEIKGLWLEADVQETIDQKFFLGAGNYPGYLIPHDFVKSDSNVSKIMQEKYGYDLKKQGFFRQAEFLKAVFEIFEVDEDLKKAAVSEYGTENPILTKTWNEIRKFTTLNDKYDKKAGYGQCDSILFAVSLGGGTATGYINPITKYIKAERNSFPVFVLGVLTEEGEDRQQKSKESRRALAAGVAIQDLLTKRRCEGVDGLILVDNQILIKLFGSDYESIDRHIYQSLIPMIESRHYPGEDTTSLAVREGFVDQQDTPPVLVPCFAGLEIGDNQEKELVHKALMDGKLFACDPNMADRAFIFSRGLLNSDRIREALESESNLPKINILVWRNFGDGVHNEVLILLRNPYGNADSYSVEGTFEFRLHRLISLALGYLRDQRDNIVHVGMPFITKNAVEDYFFGRNGFVAKAMDAKSRVEKGKRPFFREELRIFSKENGDLPRKDEPTVESEDLIRKIAREEAEKVIRGMM